MRDKPGGAAGLRPVRGSADVVHRLLEAALGADEFASVVIRTSGSTGRPKDVVLSVAALRASAEATLRRIGGPGRWLLALPVAYVAGLQVLTRSVLAGTVPVRLERDESLSAATSRLEHERRYLACVPTQLFRWLGDAADRTALSAYDAVLIGGAGAGAELLESAAAASVPVVTTYGTTETCGGCVYDGIGLDSVAIALDEAGRIRLAGPMLFEGYAAEPGLTEQVLRDGWFHTGDVGRIDEDGRLVVEGRRDDVVVSGGVNVSLPAVERRIAESPLVRDVCVVGRPDPEWGAVVTAFVVASGPVDADQIRDFVADRLPRSWAPRAVVAVDTVPYLRSGKADRQALLRAHGDGG